MYSSSIAAGDHILYTQYNNLRKDTFPVGSILMYGAEYATSGWLLCNGQSLDTTTYSDLFAVIGYTFGGAGANFNVPDLREKFIIGVKSGTYDLADTGGSNEVILTIAEMPSHTHGINNSGTHTHTFNTYTTGTTQTRPKRIANTAGTVSTTSIPNHNHGGTTGNTGEISPTTLDLIPAYQALQFIILHGLSADVAQYDQLLDSQLNNTRIESGLPGMIGLFGNDTVATGWLLCDGSAISRTIYSDLFNVIGTTFGIGDGSSTFNVPNLSNKFVRCISSSIAIGSTGTGSKTLVATNLPQHNHTITDDGGHAHSIQALVIAGGLDGVQRNTNSDDSLTLETTSSDGAHDHSGNTGTIGSATAFTVLPKYLSLAYMIKY